MFKSHLFSMVVYALIVSVMLSFIKFDEKKAIVRYMAKLFSMMVLGVIAGSWAMNLI